MIIKETIKNASEKLKKNSIESHLLDAEIMLSDIMSIKKEFLLLNEEKHVSQKVINKYNKAIERRSANEPVAYILGKKEFWSIDFSVNNNVLIPRPETELLVDEVVRQYKDKKINILDIGTGSGCILISILKELNFSRGVGIDISAKAIQLAQKNAAKFKLLNRSSFRVNKIDNFNTGKYDLIVSNPPYIPERNLKQLSKEITHFEPLEALNGGNDGLDLIKKVIYKSKRLLKKNGTLAIEVGNHQYREVSNLLRLSDFRELKKVHDYKNNVRCIISTN